MGIWDKEREAYVERQRQRVASLYSKYKSMPNESAEEREQKVQLFIDDFLIPKFKELIKSKPYSNRLTISFRCNYSIAFNTSFYSTASPFELDYYNGLWIESEYDSHLIYDAFKKLKENYSTYEISCKDKHTFASSSVIYEFNLFLE